MHTAPIENYVPVIRKMFFIESDKIINNINYQAHYGYPHNIFHQLMISSLK
jgi:hypothetical protein